MLWRYKSVEKHKYFCEKNGEVVVIIGPSGCGKSTLLRCLNGLEEIQEGEVLLDDQVVNPNKKNLSKTEKNRNGIPEL